MQFINITSRTVYTSFSGTLMPGQCSSDGGPKRKRLEQALAEVVDICGSSLGIRLNAREADLLNKLISLDEKGGGFDKSTLPSEALADPTGEKRHEAARNAAQNRENDNLARNAAEDARREAEINGETDAARKPVGPATMQGETVTPSMLKSGFEQIMEENARIASGKQNKADVGEMLDPIGAHAKKDGMPDAAQAPADVDPVGAEPVAVSMANHMDGDGTKSADTVAPVPQAPERGSEMDRQAAEIAAGLSTLGPVDAKGKPKTRGRGRAK